MLASNNTSKLVFYYDNFYVIFFLSITQKLMPSEKFWFQIWNQHRKIHRLKEKNNSFWDRYVHKVKFYQSLGRSYMFFIYILWSAMISYNASIAQICVFFELFDRQWSLTMPRPSVAQMCVLFRLNDRQWSLSKPRSLIYVFYLFSMIVNDLLKGLGRPNMCIF